jgi:integrase
MAGREKRGHKQGGLPRFRATPLLAKTGIDWGTCHICPGRPSRRRGSQLCTAHYDSWRKHRNRRGDAADYEQWLVRQEPLPGYGNCLVSVCPEVAETPMGPCAPHRLSYYSQRQRKRDALRAAGEEPGSPDTQSDRDGCFRRWCATEDPHYRIGVVNLIGLRPLPRAEMQWGLWAHTRTKHHSNWDLTAVQRLANHCRREDLTSLCDLLPHPGARNRVQETFGTDVTMIIGEVTAGLRCVYYSPQDTKNAGFLETEHFGRRFLHTQSNYDLTAVPQRWLRDLLWEHLASILRSPECPRTRGPFDNLRRGCVEFGAFLEVGAPGGGHDPAFLREEHGQRFAADLRHRARHGLAALGLRRTDGKPSTVTESVRGLVFNAVRRLLYGALESGEAARIGLDTGVIRSLPGGGETKRARRPFTDQVAKSLADEANLVLLAELDVQDRGLRDIWEVIILTGRRGSEVVSLRLDCIGHHGGLPMLWHDQTKVGNYDEAIRIPEVLYERIDARRDKTLTRFEHRHGRLPTAGERARMALFPTAVRNPHEEQTVTRQHFSRCSKTWVDGLDLGAVVPHQARHTLATNLLRAGASLAHIRRYLGHVSDRMAEHYTQIAHSDLEDVLHTVWVAGPGSGNPGELLSGGAVPLDREQALALAVDLSRRSTPAEGGFAPSSPWSTATPARGSSTATPVTSSYSPVPTSSTGGANRSNGVLSPNGPPDDATADYLRQVFEPTARAIEGLEKALAGLELLGEALALNLRRPQDYFHRIWSTNFRAIDLAAAAQAPTPTEEPAS